MKAIICTGPGTASLVNDWPRPKLRPSYIRVLPRAFALNPTDWKSLEIRPAVGHLIGCDYAGVIEELGTGYEKDFKVGDRIAGLAHGSNSYENEDGAFAESIVVKADCQLRIPDNVSDEEAATLGVSFITCGQALFQELGLSLPSQLLSEKRETILIYGGSTSTAALAIQYATIAGYAVISTCSPRNNDYVRSLGAVAVFDYKSSSCVEDINRFTGGKLRLVFDTISVQESAQICANVVSPEGHYVAVLPTKCPNEAVKSSFVLAYTSTGEPSDKGWYKTDGKLEDFEFAKQFARVTEHLLGDGKLKTHKARVSHDGFTGIVQGLALLKEGKVSAEKLVYLL